MRMELYRRSHALLRLDIVPFAVVYLALHGRAWASSDSRAVTLSLVLIPLVLVAHVLTFLSQRWSVRCRCAVAFRRCGAVADAEFALVSDGGRGDLVPVRCEADRGGEAWLSFQRRVFILDCGDWRPLDYPGAAAACADAGMKSAEQLSAAQRKWGANTFEIPEPTFLELFEEHYVAPFFVFQVLCCVLWSLDEYWVYSTFTLLMLLVFEATVCLQRQRSLELLREMRKPPRAVYAWRDGAWRLCLSDGLVPGDVFSVSASARGRAWPRAAARDAAEACVPCDAVLVSGGCVVNEAMLTGESAPQRKDALQGDEETLHLDAAHRRHAVFGGTEILDASPGSGGAFGTPPDGGAVGVALKTGFETSQGKLMRTILFSTERVVGSSETGAFIATLLVFALAAAAFVLRAGLADPRRNRFKLCLHCILIVTSVVPPELPMELSLAVTNSLAALARHGIFCTEPFRIAFAGAVDVCCFDKTGTLTCEQLEVQGVAAPPTRRERRDADDLDGEPPIDAAPSMAAIHRDADVARIMAACHSLSCVQRAAVGDSLEKAQLAAVGWALAADDVVAPAGRHEDSGARLGTLRIVHRYAFSSELRRMSTVAVSAADPSAAAWVLTKGAPEVVKALLADAPPGYDAAYRAHARRGFRVLALASKRLASAPSAAPPRAQAESGLVLRGFLVFASPLKPSTAAVISQLQKSSHRCVMITGDEVLTALHVARTLRMATKNQAAVCCLHQGKVAWHIVRDADDADDADDEFLPFDLEGLAGLAATHDIVVRGDALEACGAAAAAALCPVAVVFARVRPEGKELVVATLNASGLTTLMCGDGTNDVGALKRAHVGVSLAADGAADFAAADDLELLDPRLVKLGDASIASPFASKMSSIGCCVVIVRQGRCTLVTMLQVFKILALMCLVSAYMLSSLYLAGVKQGDTQMTFVGLLTAMLFFLASRAAPLDELSEKRPPRRVFELRPSVSIVAQFAVHLSALVFVVRLCEPYHRRDDPSNVPDGPFAPSVINTAVFLLSALVQLNTFATNYCGHPFMQSLSEHKALSRTLAASYAIFFVAATGLVPSLSRALQLVDAPSPAFRTSLLALLGADTTAVWALSLVI